MLRLWLRQDELAVDEGRKLSKLHPRRAETYARLAVYEQPPVDLKER
jgi:hypothetical protein